MITLEDLERWISAPSETEVLEFKAATQQYDKDKLVKYCAAIANEKGGYLLLGVSDAKPRKITNSQAFSNEGELNSVKKLILDKLGIRVEVTELLHKDGRVLVFAIPSRPLGTPIGLEGAYWMRNGESLVAMTPDQLKRIMDEDKPDWFSQNCVNNIDADEVVRLLDTQAFFDLKKIPYPTDRTGVLERLKKANLIKTSKGKWSITNLGAITFAKKLDEFPEIISRKAPRVILYDGFNKLKTKNETIGTRGYACAFEGLVTHVHNLSPNNHYIEETIREDVKMFPKQALRELIANALVHQDFSQTGTSVMIEMYDDRIEISNPGTPPIETDRFIDEHKSVNEPIASLLRNLGICEEKGSGIDKVVYSAELYQLPAPDFRVGKARTNVVLFSHKQFSDMNKDDRIRACYQHCVLQYVSNAKMSNQSLRERFKLSERQSNTVSAIIKSAIDDGVIIADKDVVNASPRNARYIPYWA